MVRKGSSPKKVIARASAAKKVWLYHPNQSRRNSEPKCGRAKAFLFDRLYNSITRHDLLECYKLLRIAPRETSIDAHVFFRYIMILVNSVRTDKVNKNFLIYLESFLSKLNLSKPDVFVEFLIYFIRNNRIDDARELLAQRQRHLARPHHRPVPFVEINLCCCKLYIDYHEWSMRSQNQLVKFDYSIQGWLVNAMDQIKQVSGNYEYFALAITKMLLAYKFNRKAYLFVSEFQRLNPDNISAQLLLFNLINLLVQLGEAEGEDKKVSAKLAIPEAVRFEGRSRELASINNFCLDGDGELFDPSAYPLATDRSSILQNLLRLDMKRNEILELSVEKNRLESVRYIMDSLECLQHIGNVTRWHTLLELLSEIFSTRDEQTIIELRNLWQVRYQRHWSLDYFLDNTMKECKDIVKKVFHLLSSRCDSSEDALEVLVDDGDLVETF